MITTSEVAVSLTIDQTENLSEIIRELNTFSAVEIDSEQSIICIVGISGKIITDMQLLSLKQ